MPFRGAPQWKAALIHFRKLACKLAVCKLLVQVLRRVFFTTSWHRAIACASYTPAMGLTARNVCYLMRSPFLNPVIVTPSIFLRHHPMAAT